LQPGERPSNKTADEKRLNGPAGKSLETERTGAGPTQDVRRRKN